MTRLLSAVLGLCLAASACARQLPRPDAATAPSADGRSATTLLVPTMNFDTPAWKAIDKLVDEGKPAEARAKLAQLRASAEQAGDNADWTRALIRDVELGTELGGVETAVRTLREAKWPADEFSQLVLELYYAATLLNYVETYSYEISRRERVVSQQAVDLKAWTREQIVHEALAALQRIWQRRDSLQGPASALGPYIELNNYPAGIRDTLRDVASYHIVELLANTSYWRPSEENDLFRLDHAQLLRGRADDAEPIANVDDAALHPLQRAAAVLVDLAAWHTHHGRTEAALEADLERLRRIHAAFSDEPRRNAQLAALTQRLAQPDLQRWPWWSMGQRLLAEWTHERGDLPRARELALLAERAHPGSVGAVAARQLIAQIEAPDFTLSGMLLDGPRRRSLQLRHRNLKRVYFRAFKSELLPRVERSQDYDLLPSGPELQALLAGTPVAQWSVDLPDLGDYASHQTYVTPPLDPYGFYTVFASAREDFAAKDNRIQAAHLFLSQLVIRHRSDADGSLELRVFDGASGQPLSQVELRIYEYNWREHHRLLTKVNTRADGTAKVARRKLGAADSTGRVFVIARRGDDVSPALGNLWLNERDSDQSTTSAFVFTDRSVYRPTQSVQWKVLAYRGRDADWQSLKRQTLTVSLHDAHGEEVDERTVTTNDYGSAAGSFTLPTGRLLGHWTVRTSLQGAAGIRVEEYKRPTFEVSLSPSREPARLNQPVTLRGEAKYYFGLPVQTGQLRWKVERTPRYPWWWCFWRPPQPAAQPIAAGKAALDAQGQFSIQFTPEADTTANKAVQFDYQVSVDLTDEGGETRSATRSFAVGHVALDARLEPASGFFQAGAGGQIALRRSNLDGDPQPGGGRYRILSLQQPARASLPADLPPARDPSDTKPRTPGDEQARRDSASYEPEAVMATWPDGREVAAAEITTASDGTATIQLPKLAGGAYRVRYEARDAFGERLEVFRDFLVVDAGTKLALPAILKLEHPAAESGSSVRVLATTGLPDQPLWLEIYSAQKLVERRSLAPGASPLQEIAIGPAQRGGIALKLVGLRDYQSLEQGASLHVPWTDRELALELATFRDRLRPGSHETFRVSVRGAKDHALVAAAELLAYMYDRSLDVFAPHTPPTPLSLLPQRAYAGRTGWGLGASQARSVNREVWYVLPPRPELHGDELVFPLALPRTLYMRAMSPMLARAPVPAPASAVEKEEDVAKKRAEPPPPAKPAAPAQAPAPEVRSNFSETAFFMPQLLTGADGSAALEFTVPDSVTAWNVWVHAITRDFRAGSIMRETRSVKDLMVRPYLPRFVRELDTVALKVVVQNAGATALNGTLTFEVFDPVTQRSLADEFGVQQAKLPFTVGPASSTNLTLPIHAPRRVGDVALRVVGQAGELSDGELRPLPLLPSRLHLVQSKFATLRGADSQRTLQLPDLQRTDDPSRQTEQLVVTVEAQLFMTVLKALPYLIDYPYECSEQTLNRFLSSGIVSSVFGKYPAVKQLAAKLAEQRSTLLDKFDTPDPNRTTQLEETPWLSAARGAPDIDGRLIKVLDPQVAAREQRRALERLQQLQTASGAFPWFPGGPPSPYMTLYLMLGLARATEFQIAVPEDMITKGLMYLGEHYRTELAQHMTRGDASAEFVSLLHFTLSSFPAQYAAEGGFDAAEQQKLLDYAFARWKELPPLLKSVLTQSLLRAKRRDDAKLVFGSVLDSARTTQDEGTFWMPESRAWLWYNDRIETHAFALRTLLELDEHDPRLEGMVVWLLLNKKLNQWKSTRATAEVIYSLVKYLDKKHALGAREAVSVQVGTQPIQQFVFEPDTYTGKAQLRIDGPDVQPAMSSIELKKTGPGVAFASATWHYATDELPSEERGDLFSVKRSYFRREAMGPDTTLVPLAEDSQLHAGDEVEVQLEIKARAQAEYIHLRDPRPAGLEPPITLSKYHFDLGLVYYEEVRDSATNFFIEWLPAGEYTLKYRLRANLAGQFRVGPATLQSMYAPEFSAFSTGERLRVD